MKVGTIRIEYLIKVCVRTKLLLCVGDWCERHDKIELIRLATKISATRSVEASQCKKIVQLG